MKTPTCGRSVILVSAGIAVAVLVVTLVVHSVRLLSWPPPEVAASPQEALPAKNFSPSLYCVFYDYLHEGIVVGFDFAVALPKGAPPRFDERAEATRDGTHRMFDADNLPTWPYAYDDDGTPTITSPDGATRIVLYGLKLDTGGVLFIEAGLRSNDYRNLDGQCRQANFGGSGHKDVLGLTPNDRAHK